MLGSAFCGVAWLCATSATRARSASPASAHVVHTALEAPSEPIEVVRRDDALVLEPADDDAGINPDVAREREHRILAAEAAQALR